MRGCEVFEVRIGSNQSLASRDFPLNNFPVLVFVPAGSVNIFERKMAGDEMTSHLQLHFGSCEVYSKTVAQG